MDELLRSFRRLSPVSDTSWQLFLEKTEEVEMPKGHLLFRANQRAHYTYFIIKGYARGFFYENGKDITFWFASEGMTLLSMNSYHSGEAGYENIELLEDSLLLRIHNKDLLALYECNPELSNLGRRLSDEFILYLERTLMEKNFMSASARYEALIRRSPEILHKSPLKHIASFLGISQVSLSRIRAGKQ
ncbi:MAG: Crp/Fnr family transcriptional regulator [Bacteroidales bacterium]